jgi:GDPmannose 4,6-dehydratase
MTTALICGVGGQDGAYLAQLLLAKGYVVVGTSRDANAAPFTNLSQLNIRNAVKTMSLEPNDFRSVLTAFKRCQPDEIYNLAGQSSVSLSFEQPVEAMESIAIGTLNFLEAIRFSERPIRFYNAGSGECFGDSGDTPATENTPFRPRSPYAVAKASAHGLVANYRDAYGIYACTGILFNHESPLRPRQFVTRKIVASAARIAAGARDTLKLGKIDIERDWGWAPDYVEAMWRIVQQSEPDDFIIATGRTVPLHYLVERAFEYFDLKWQDYVESDPTMFRPSDIQIGRANPEKAYKRLGWKATRHIEQVIDEMCRAEIKSIGAASPG